MIDILMVFMRSYMSTRQGESVSKLISIQVLVDERVKSVQVLCLATVTHSIFSFSLDVIWFSMDLVPNFPRASLMKVITNVLQSTFVFQMCFYFSCADKKN